MDRRGLTVVLVALLAVAMLTTLEPMSAPNQPQQIHVTLDQLPKHLRVQWSPESSYSPADAPILRFRIGPHQHAVQATLAGVAAATDSSDTTQVWSAPLGPLEPGSTVRYQISAGKQPGPWHAVRALPEPGAPLRLVAHGDLGRLDLRGNPNTNVTAVRDLALAQNPDLFLPLGDLGYQDIGGAGSVAHYDAFMRLMEPLHASVVTMPVWGNHEKPNTLDGFQQSEARWMLPGDEHDYMFTAGPVRFVALNSDRAHSEPGGTAPPHRPATTTRLRAMLATASTDDLTPWRIVYFHHPPYSYGTHGNTTWMHDEIVPLLEHHGVDLILSGHDHNFQRSYPLQAGEPVSTLKDGYTQGQAPIYVVAGGGGKDLTPLDAEPIPPWVAASEVAFHTVVVEADPRQLTVRVLAAPGGDVLDQFTIRRDVPPPAGG